MQRQQPQSYLLHAIAVGMALSCDVLAQIATDSTLGRPATPLAGPNYAITDNLGRQVGTNLFHSFSTFNLTSAESATFSGPGSIGNIISRVTGTTASNIDGLLRSTIAGANLFLINPRGILFGPNASLDLTGSFHASTANYIKLGESGRFDATNPGASVLTMAPPSAFGFLGPNPAPITVQGSNLSVPEGKSLSLVGGPITVSDATLRTVAGDIRLVAMGGTGEVPVDATGASLAGMPLASINIERSTLATDSGAGTAPGRIVIRGGQITVLESNITSTNWGDMDAPPVELAAAGDLTVSGSNVIGWNVGTALGPDLMLSGTNITVDHNAQVLAETYAQGPGGSISLSATQAVQVNAAPEDPGYSNVYTFTYSDGAAGSIRVTGDTVTVKSGNVYSGTGSSGNSGAVLLQGREVSVIDGGYVFTYTGGGTSGNSRNVDILASERSFIAWGDWSDPPFWTRIFSETQGTGRAGDVTITAPEIVVRGGYISSTTYAAGNAGSIRFYADVIRMSGGNGIPVVVESGASDFTTGNGGNVEIRATREFEMTRGDIVPWEWARIAATTQGNGRGGEIIVEAPRILLDNAAIFSRTRFGTGDQGGIIVRADELRLQNFGRIVSTTEGNRKGSFILVEAKDVQLRDNSAIAAVTSGSSDAGQVTINAQRLKMTGASSIQVNSGTNSGNAGDIVLNIGESLEIAERGVFLTNPIFSAPYLEWPGGLRSQAEGTGNAGSIFIRAPSVLLDDGRILTTALQSGQGGRVEIHADNLVMRNGAQIDARSATGSTGDAGSIDISVAGRFEISGLSPIDGAFSGLYAQTQGSGRGGNIGVGADTLVVDRGLIRSSAGATGNAGTIRIRAGDVVLANGGWIDAGTTLGSTGAGGSIDIAATRSMIIGGIDRSAITQSLMETQQLNITPGTPGRVQGPFSSIISSNTAGAGAGGNVSLSAPQITVADGGQVSANSSGTGTAGNIFIQAPEWLKLAGGSITTQAMTSDGGNIDIRAGNMVRLSYSEISTSVGDGTGSGGNIFIDPTFVILEHSRIAANAFGGAGGSINIISDFFFASPDSLVEASSQLGVLGSVQIAGLRTDAGQSLAQLPAAFLDASALLQPSCAGRAGPRASSFIGVGRGGLAAAPDGYSASRYFADTGLPYALASDPATPDAPRVAAPSAPLLLASACVR